MFLDVEGEARPLILNLLAQNGRQITGWAWSAKHGTPAQMIG